MIPALYNSLSFAAIENLSDFFKTNLPEMAKVKGVLESCKLSLNLPPKKVIMMVAEGQRVYKYIFLSPGLQNVPIGWLVYLPIDRRLDFYLPDSPVIPIIQWKGKKIEFKNYPVVYDLLGFSKLFDKIVNII